MRNLLVGLLIGFLLALGASGRAQTWIVGSGLVHHFGDQNHCHNAITPGIGIEHKDWAAGIYSNSQCSFSAYLAKAWMPFYLQSLNLRIGGLGGVVTGYPTSPLPVAALAASWEGERYGVNLIALPPAGESGKGLLWLQWKVKW